MPLKRQEDTETWKAWLCCLIIWPSASWGGGKRTRLVVRGPGALILASLSFNSADFRQPVILPKPLFLYLLKRKAKKNNCTHFLLFCMNGMDSLPISFPGSSVGKESITSKQPQILNLFSWCPFVTGLKAWVSDENTSLSLGLLQSYIFKKFPKAYGFGFFILYFLSLLFASVFFVLSPSFSLDHQSPGPRSLSCSPTQVFLFPRWL